LHAKILTRCTFASDAADTLRRPTPATCAFARGESGVASRTSRPQLDRTGSNDDTGPEISLDPAAQALNGDRSSAGPLCFASDNKSPMQCARER
jgi:hypothetical protein